VTTTGLARAWPLVAVLAVIAALGFASPPVQADLAWARSPLAAGELWRLVTGHLVHVGAVHLAMNATGLALVAVVFGRDFRPREWWLLLLVAVAAVDAGLAMEYSMETYRGLSGVLHALFAASLAARAARAEVVAAILLSLLVVKVVVESYRGGGTGTAAFIGVEAATVAHLVGVMAGTLWGVRRRRR
jgi:rhomboid family GlyGly-CTERM serine protease